MFRLLGFGLGLSVCLASGACDRKRRYDGTCTEDSHCLEMQKCAGGVCIRKDPIFKETLPKRTEPPSIQRSKRNVSPTPTTPTAPAAPETPREAPMQNSRPNENRPEPNRSPGAFRFRLDA